MGPVKLAVDQSVAITPSAISRESSAGWAAGLLSGNVANGGHPASSSDR